ncbi:MAG: phospholipid carrier-dependent glycosyltransferase [Acidobacteria bacterium]|nr:phospholipid carrier-dependent glycosyltransferase [Acidobacteriota bacterium]
MTRSRALTILWLIALAALYAVHFVHLRADFPNGSPWMDYSKYTDEGWYGNAAVRLFERGNWYLKGDFNPAIALPVWPALLAALFHLTGVSLVAARGLELAVFGAAVGVMYLLVRQRESRWTALLAATLAMANVFLYSFARLAILEPLLILLTLASWLLLLHLPRHRLALLTATGLLLCLSVLTKTTAIFFFPATLYLLWRMERKRFWRSAGVVTLATALPWSAWYLLVVRPHYLVDFHYLFAANKWEQPSTLNGWVAAFWYAVHGTLWVDPWLCGVAAVLLLLSLVWLRELWGNPLYGTSLLAAGGYIFFTGWHNSMQPRYYETVAFALFLTVSLGTAALRRRNRQAGTVAMAVLAISVAVNVRQMVSYAVHPQYSFLGAAKSLTRYIETNSKDGNRLLLSISGDQIALATGLPAICDDFGTYDLPYRIHQYRPGWFATWNEIDAGTLEDLRKEYSLEQVAEYPAFDDPDRNLLILYRLRLLPAAQRHYDAKEEARENAGR